MLTQKVESEQLMKDLRGSTVKGEERFFEARVRYVASSQIITIPVRVSRELELKIGDIVKISLEKKNSEN